MDAQNNPVENGADQVSPAAASDPHAERWRLILLVLCAVGAGLVIGILALQFTEYAFYKASPNVWPQPGSAGAVSAPATQPAPLAPGAPVGATP